MRVLIADDSLLMREGIARILSEAGLEVAGLSDDLPSLLEAVRQTMPDVVVADIRMPPTFTDEGLQAVEQIRAEHGHAVGVLVLSQHFEAQFALGLVANGGGGVGYLLKERIADLEDFAEAVRRVGRGGSIVDPAIVRELLERRRREIPGTLTDREREALALMAEGRSNAAIGVRMRIGSKTVETHINAIFSKLGLEPATDDNRRVLAVLAYLDEGSGAPGFG